MGALSVIETVSASEVAFLSQVTTVLVTETGDVLLYDTASGTSASATVGGADLSFSTSTLSSGGGYAILPIGGSDFILPMQEFLALIAAGDGGSHSVQLNLSTDFADKAELSVIEVGGITYVVAALSSGDGISVFSVNESGTTGAALDFTDGFETHLANISALSSLTVGANSYVLVASATEDGLTLMQIDAGGDLTVVDSFSSEEGLPIANPTDMETLTYGGKSLVFLTSYDSSSITVLEVTEDGTMVAIDQVNDTLLTRFGGAMAVDVIDHDGTAYLAVAGNDGGLSVFKVLPDGTLVHWTTMSDTADLALQNVSSLNFVETSSGLELIVTTTGDTGMTRLAVDVASQGSVRENGTGTQGDDVILTPDGGGSANGQGGDDILVDGNGSDTLTGGNGSDLFQFRPDGETDYITDFDYKKDKIDLSHFPLSGSVKSVEIEMTAQGFILHFGGERLVVTTHDGMSVPIAAFTDILLFNADHVLIGPRIDNLLRHITEGTSADDMLFGTSSDDYLYGYGGDDVFVATAGTDYIDGGDGIDTVDYSLATQAITVDLENRALNLGAANDHTLVNVENIIGTIYGDTIKGDGNSNILNGYDGADILYGRDGDDILIGGMGADILDGGDGIDTASYAKFTTDLVLNLADPTQNQGLGAEGDVYISIENITSGNGNDIVYGDDNDNHIYTRLGNDTVYAGGGNDVVVASRGHDIVYGGDGNDVLNGGYGNDVLYGEAGNDRLVGEDGNDSLYNSEGVGWLIAGPGDDFLSDGSGNSVLAGNAGNDTILAGGGNDRCLGDSGDDYIDGGNGADRITGGEGNDYLLGGNGNDIFVFRDGMDIDRIGDFTYGEDRLFINTSLLNGETDAAAVIARYATVSGTDIIIDFGDGDMIILEGVTNLSHVTDSILLV